MCTEGPAITGVRRTHSLVITPPVPLPVYPLLSQQFAIFALRGVSAQTCVVGGAGTRERGRGVVMCTFYHRLGRKRTLVLTHTYRESECSSLVFLCLLLTPFNSYQ